MNINYAHSEGVKSTLTSFINLDDLQSTDCKHVMVSYLAVKPKIILQ